MNKNTLSKERIIEGGALLLVIVLIVGSFFAYKLFSQTKKQGIKIADLENTITDLNGALFDSKNENLDLLNSLTQEKGRNDDFENQIKKISGTVGTLEKLSKTDPELLQKYSKIYFLNEHYVPSELIQISKEFSYPESKILQFHAKAWPHLEDLLRDAEDDKINLKVESAYRSFGTQAALKYSYKVTYGAGTANAFSADQGYSEHQLGTTIDFTTSTLGANFNAFDSTDAYKWLQENAYKYGFILSYPKTNQYYQFEPWHWRFVGEDLARKLHKDNVNFYDMDQRAINEYLVSIFD